MTLICYTDGGYKQTRNPKGYGSFAIYRGDTLVKISHFDLPTSKTSNESEYLSLIQLLGYLEKNLNNEPAFIYTDSRLMYNQVSDRWKILAENLRILYNIICVYKIKLNITLIWIGRRTIVKILGH